MEMLAHITPTEVPSFWVTFLAGLVTGVFVTAAVVLWKRR